MKLEAKTRLTSGKTTAAAVPTATRIKLLKELFKNANLKKFGLTNEGEAIIGADIDRAKQIAIGKALAALGWNTKARKGVSRADGTWPLIIQVDKQGGFQLEVSNHDNVDRNVAKEAVREFKAVLKEVAKTLGVKTTEMKRSPGRTGAGASVVGGELLTPEAAEKTMKASGYGKAVRKDNQLMFAKEHAHVILGWAPGKGLVYITVQVI